MLFKDNGIYKKKQMALQKFILLLSRAPDLFGITFQVSPYVTHKSVRERQREIERQRETETETERDRDRERGEREKAVKIVSCSYFSRCVKSVQIRSFLWYAFSCIRTEYRKIQTRKSSVFGQFSDGVCVAGSN